MFEKVPFLKEKEDRKREEKIIKDNRDVSILFPLEPLGFDSSGVFELFSIFSVRLLVVYCTYIYYNHNIILFLFFLGPVQIFQSFSYVFLCIFRFYSAPSFILLCLNLLIR